MASKNNTPASPAQKKAAHAALSPPTPDAAPASPVRPAAALAPKSPTSSPTLRIKRPLPAKSVQKAAYAFKIFSLSRFAKTPSPANYVPAAQAKTPSAVAAAQRKSMTLHTAALAANPPQTSGLTVALTAQSLRKLLPSLDAKANTVDATELLSVLKQNLRGREFYASGNPTLNIVVQDSALLSQVQGYISAIKGGTVGSVTGAPGPVAKPAVAVKAGAGAKARAVVKPGAASSAAAAKKAAAPFKKGGA